MIGLVGERHAVPRRRRRGSVSLLGGVLLAGALTGCATDTAVSAPADQHQEAGQGSGQGSGQEAEQDGEHSAGGAHAGQDGGQANLGPRGLPSVHVHGVAIDPGDDRVHLATHDGLFRYDDAGPVRVGPVIDLMGFTVAGPDHFYASGHPGPGTDLTDPVGLIESVDGGATWTQVSRAGESDFHALSASAAGVVGYDGTIRTSPDGRAWATLDPPVEPFALAASPDGVVVVAAAESGPIRSTDAGVTWAPVSGALRLQVVDWAEDQTVIGVSPGGVVAVSEDAGATWTEHASTGGPPQAVGASTTAQGSLRVLVVTTEEVLDSTDGGTTFAALGAA